MERMGGGWGGGGFLWQLYEDCVFANRTPFSSHLVFSLQHSCCALFSSSKGQSSDEGLEQHGWSGELPFERMSRVVLCVALCKEQLRPPEFFSYRVLLSRDLSDCYPFSHMETLSCKTVNYLFVLLPTS